MSEDKGSTLRKNGVVGKMLVHSATLSLVLLAILLFSGWSYMYGLYRDFGLRAGILGLGKVDLALAGVVPLFWIVWTTGRSILLMTFIVIPLALITGAMIAVYIHEKKPRHFDRLVSHLDRFKPWLPLQLVFGLLAVFISLGAGYEAAKIDALSIRKAAKHSPLCYTFTTYMFRGRMIGQSPEYTVLKTRLRGQRVSRA